MCRLLMLTDTTENIRFRQMLFAHLMTLAAADEAQTDGWGVTDGVTAARAGWTFLRRGINHVRRLQGDGILLGHVRKASRGTSITSNEAHPFRYENNGRPFWLAHNGYITGTGGPLKDEPDSDTYRVGKRLEKALGGGAIDGDVLTDWANQFGYGSEYAFMMLQDGVGHIIRGQRPMAYMQIGRGYFFATKPELLENLATFIAFWAPWYEPQITEVEPMTYIRVRINEPLEAYKLEAKNLAARKPLWLQFNGKEWQNKE